MPSVEDEAVIVAFRKHTVLQRHGISWLPDVEGDKPGKNRFKSYPIGYFPIDIAEVQTAEGKLYVFAATDRTSKFAFARLVPTITRNCASTSPTSSAPTTSDDELNPTIAGSEHFVISFASG